MDKLIANAQPCDGLHAHASPELLIPFDSWRHLMILRVEDGKDKMLANDHKQQAEKREIHIYHNMRQQCWQLKVSRSFPAMKTMAVVNNWLVAAVDDPLSLFWMQEDGKFNPLPITEAANDTPVETSGYAEVPWMASDQTDAEALQFFFGWIYDNGEEGHIGRLRLDPKAGKARFLGTLPEGREELNEVQFRNVPGIDAHGRFWFMELIDDYAELIAQWDTRPSTADEQRITYTDVSRVDPRSGKDLDTDHYCISDYTKCTRVIVANRMYFHWVYNDTATGDQNRIDLWYLDLDLSSWCFVRSLRVPQPDSYNLYVSQQFHLPAANALSVLLVWHDEDRNLYQTQQHLLPLDVGSLQLLCWNTLLHAYRNFGRLSRQQYKALKIPSTVVDTYGL